MVRRKKVKKRIRSFLLLLLLIIIFGIFYKGINNYKNKNNIVDHIINNNNNIAKEHWPKEYKLSFLATGDGLIHNLLHQYAETKDGSYNFSKYLTEVKDIVSSKDIAYYNQETIFGGKEIGISSYPTFNTPSEFGDAMLDIGFNTVSLASNHSMDKGIKGALNSVQYWKSKNNILYNGMANSLEDRNNFIIMEKNNIKYGMISYTYGTNGIPVPKDKPYLVNLYSDEQAKIDIENLRNKVDVLMVAMHWGIEYQQYPTEEQKRQAKYLADLGVDIIIGNHSHSIQPVDFIDNTLVIYSMGNFISNQIERVNSIGYKGVIGDFVMADITKTVNKDKTSSINIDNVNVELLYTYRDKTKKIYKVVPFSKMSDKYFDKYLNKKNYMQIYNDYKAVVQKYNPNIYVIPAA